MGFRSSGKKLSSTSTGSTGNLVHFDDLLVGTWNCLYDTGVSSLNLASCEPRSLVDNAETQPMFPELGLTEEHMTPTFF